MYITIVRQGLKSNEVYFTAGCGEGRGIWQGPQAAAVGAESQVEFELPELLMRWVDIVPVPPAAPAIRLEGERVVFTGILENIEEDGTGFLRLGQDLLMFECMGEPMMLGSCVELSASEVRIYPFIS
ncbi:hypothetical protein [Paenibacillus donghaensis]|uniref:Uncharacterized protein n=1 Tax=Paenibacillus donghaensis TaxID=414771 RepID=A0A2Z2KYD9_9BACL|nr:hypothetical protein [Paenibacillus donghaensis]ASA25498.1 hypothetical protein B9T62_35070 [Paenibacillus donghaensis]